MAIPHPTQQQIDRQDCPLACLARRQRIRGHFSIENQIAYRLNFSPRYTERKVTQSEGLTHCSLFIHTLKGGSFVFGPHLKGDPLNYESIAQSTNTPDLHVGVHPELGTGTQSKAEDKTREGTIVTTQGKGREGKGREGTQVTTRGKGTRHSDRKKGYTRLRRTSTNCYPTSCPAAIGRTRE